MTQPTVAILGGGAGGLVVSRGLRRRLGAACRVVLVERRPLQAFAPSLLWVMTGARRPEQITTDVRRQRQHGVEVIEADVLGFDTAARMVKTSEGAVHYDRAVVALGAEFAPDVLPGFADAAHCVYTLEGALAARRALGSLDDGRVAVLVSRLPYKCPAAPYETAMLAEALLRRRGVRDRVTIDVYTPEPFPMPTAGPVLGEALKELLRARGIGFHPEHTAQEIDTDRRELVFSPSDRAGFDVLLGVPPHRPPDVIGDSGLAGNTGFIPVDPTTLRTEVEDVFALGDVTAIPIAGGRFLPKAGVFAHAEAEVVAQRIAEELSGKEPSTTFDGHGACFVEIGDGRAAYATGDFYAPDAPRIRLRRPGRTWHLGKVAFERYWLRRWA